MTACLECKHVSRKLSFHTDLSLPVSFSDDHQVLSPVLVGKFFKDQNEMTFKQIQVKFTTSKSLKTCRLMFKCLLGQTHDENIDSEEDDPETNTIAAKPVNTYRKPINVAVEADPNTDLYSQNNNKAESTSKSYKS